MSIRGLLISPLLGRRNMQWFFEGCLELAIRGMNLSSPCAAPDTTRPKAAGTPDS